MLDILTVHRRLLEFYGRPDLGDHLSPLDELVVTILSQNTNDANRDRAFAALKRRFPEWETVRDADTQAVIEAIRPAGLANQKGPRIQDILRKISEKIADSDGNLEDRLTVYLHKLASEVPAAQVRQWLMQFKGVGPKTAAIVMLFSLSLPAFPVDTHIYRVSGRLGLRDEKMSVEQVHEHLEAQFPAEARTAEIFTVAHLNLIRLGREICRPRRPSCPACPLNDLCRFHLMAAAMA